MITRKLSSFCFAIPIAAFLFFAAFSVSAQDVSKLDEDYSFVGYSLASHQDSIRNLRKNGKQDHLRIMRPGNLDSLYFNKIELKQVKLYYFHGVLHSVDVKTDEPQTTHLLAWLTDRYGDGEQKDMFGNEIVWLGERAKLTFEKNPVMGTGLFSCTSKRMHVKYVTYMYDITHGDKADK